VENFNMKQLKSKQNALISASELEEKVKKSKRGLGRSYGYEDIIEDGEE